MKKARTLLLSLLLAAAAEGAAPRPNVIFILCDDLGWGDLGVTYQNSRTSPRKFATPRLDAFAAGGMQLRRHYAPAPVCAPSRASLLLGVHQGHANVRNNQFDQTLEANHTLGTVMKAAGYATACIGKWGLQGPGVPAQQPSHPSRRGFDYFFGSLSHLSGHFHYPQQLTGNDNQGQPNAFFDQFDNVTAQLANCYSTDLFTARAKKWIADQHDTAPEQPFFLYLSYTAPHARLDVPTQAYPAGDGLDGGLQWTGTPGAMINTAGGATDSFIHPDHASQPDWTPAAKRHATMVRRIDDAVGDLLATLEELGEAENTLIVFTSDNGPANEAGSGGSFTHDPRFFGSYGPLEGIKRDVLEGGMRVPTLVHWPARISGGAISETPSQFHDWLPTFAELAGVPQPERSDGVSLVPTLTGSGAQRDSTVYVEYSVSGNTPGYTEFVHHAGDPRNEMQVVFLDGYKGIRTGIGSHDDAFRVYDTLADPAEGTNLAGGTGVPSGERFRDRVLQVRRASAASARGYLDSRPVPAAPPAGVTPGLEWAAYEMTAPWVPDWETETPAATGTAASPDLSVRTRGKDIGLLFRGYLRVPAEGIYTFHLTTDTGAFVRLHDLQLVDADYGYTGGTERSSGAIRLAAGDHPIRIHYRHGAGAGHGLSLAWTGPGIGKQEVPATAFFRQGTTVPAPPTAWNDTARVSGNALIDVLANDLDDGTPAALSIASVGHPRHGTAVIEGTAIRYTPRPGFAGEDRFSYTITDGADTAAAEVTVNVLPATSLVWLPLDESGGTVASDALERPIGVLQNFPGSPWTAGRLGNGLAFDGTQDRLSLPGVKGVTGTAARTVSFWIRADAVQVAGTRPTIVSWGAGNGSATGTRFDINLNHTNGYKLRAEFNAAGVNFTTPARSDLRGAGWVHVAVVVPENATVSSITGYLDGVAATPEFEPAASGTAAINTGSTYDVSIGRIADATTARVFSGVIDDVRIYPVALDAARVAALAAGDPQANLRHLWYFRHTGTAEPSAADWLEDADGDGFTARLEFALGGNPTAADPSIAPVLEDGVFRFTRRREGIAPGDYRAEWSPDLAAGSWEELTALTVEPHPLDAALETVSAALPADSPAPPRRFVRLRVQD